MVHRPKSVMGYVLLALLAVIALGVIYIVLAIPDTSLRPWVWGTVAVIVLASLVVIAWRRRVEAAREQAWIGSFSFADVVTRRRHEETLARDESRA